MARAAASDHAYGQGGRACPRLAAGEDRRPGPHVLDRVAVSSAAADDPEQRTTADRCPTGGMASS